jgi:peptidoglycan/LPS O-acetylase OafA/YrhL
LPKVAFFHPLNFIRFVLAVGVVLFHYGKNYFPFNSGPLHTLIVNSSFRVSFFFFISGFVMCLVYAPQVLTLTPREFYFKRLSRILPMYWLAFIASILLILFVLHASPKGLVVVVHFLGLQSFYSGYVLDLNFTAWSISVELVFYSVFPFLLRWMMRMSPGRALYVILQIWVLQTIQHTLFVENLYDGTKRMEEFISAFPLWHIPTFLGGMAAARFIHDDGLPEGVRKITAPVFLACLAVFAWVVLIPNPILKYVHNGLLMPVFALTILSLYYDKGVIHRVFSNRVLVRLGDLSYAIFIFQYPVWMACTAFSDESSARRSSFFISYFLILILFAWLANSFLEKPVLRYLRDPDRSWKRGKQSVTK